MRRVVVRSAAAEPKHAETAHSAHTSSLTNFASEGISAQAAL